VAKLNHWLLTDTHFGHARMHDFCNRPVGFEKTILTRLDSTVKCGDVLYHLGDFCFGNDARWHRDFMSACAGRKILIRGNHDKKSITWYYEHGWDVVCDELRLKLFGKDILLSHKPSDSFCDINIHGHHHNKGVPGVEVSPFHKLIMMEHDYMPQKLRTVVGQ
jgi:calcineurin-like phosphoesterase family protein